MSERSWLLTLAACLSVCASHRARASDLSLTRPPTCEPGYTYVQETHYREVVNKVCCPCPGVARKTKWCYSCKSEDYCLMHHSRGRDSCGACGEGQCGKCVQCSRPQTRHLLIKRQVETECPETKCKVQSTVEWVPYTVWRKVPCGPHGQPLVPPAPMRTGSAPALVAPPAPAPMARPKQ